MPEPTIFHSLNNHRILDHKGLECGLNRLGKSSGGISPSKDLDRIPRAMAQSSPDYSSARRISEAGLVMAEYDVDTSDASSGRKPGA